MYVIFVFLIKKSSPQTLQAHTYAFQVCVVKLLYQDFTTHKHSLFSVHAGFGFPLPTGYGDRPPLRIRNNPSYAHSMLTCPAVLTSAHTHTHTHKQLVLASGISLWHTAKGMEIPNQILLLNILLLHINSHDISVCFAAVSRICLETHLWLSGIASQLFGIASSVSLGHACADWHNPMSMCVRDQWFRSSHGNESLLKARRQNKAFFLFLSVSL